MYDYMTALQRSFCPEVNYQEIERRVAELKKILIPKLTGEEWKQILALVDEQDLLREQSNLENFITGFRLACGISRELSEEPPYSFELEEETRARQAFMKGGED